MKQLLFIIVILFISLSLPAQVKPKEKAPTQRELEEMMKEAQQMIGELSDEDKKAMDSLGIKIPDFKKVPKVSDKQLADAADKEGRIVPKRNTAKIAQIPKAIGAGQMPDYIAATNQKLLPLLNAALKGKSGEIFNEFKKKNPSPDYLGNAAMGLWMMGYTELAYCIMAKACEQDASNANNLNNYAAMLTMMGAAHLAIPVLDNLNLKFSNNNTILNNLGQAWFLLGETPKAEKYINETIALYANHSQANFTKCLIEESKGNIPAAIVAIKRSIQGGHTPEKETKLQQLGEKPNPKDDRFPQNMKNDPMNLGGFNPPRFPISVMECVTLGLEWAEFRGLLNQKITQLEAAKEQASKAAEKFMARRQQENIALIQASQQAGQLLGNLTSAPLYAKRAERQLNEVVITYGRKINDHMTKVKAFMGTGNELRLRYEEKMAKLRKEDLDQTGEGKPNANFCPKYREASDAYLKAYNSQLEVFFKEYLQIEKDFLNQSTHWRMYTDFPETYEVAKLGAQIQWLKYLGATVPYGFISITKYACDPPPPNKSQKLQKFDDVACKYKSEIRLPCSKITSNCSILKGEFDCEFLKISITTDAEKGKTFREQLVGCTFEVGVSKGIKDLRVGPVKVEASVGVTAGVEIDGTGIKDFIIGGGIEAGVELDGTAGSTSAGVGAKVSLVSGHATAGLTGIFEKL
ncbi:MAG: hypothetical protein KF862_03860 [Chitinophagaceae bacterium]|nr:hypothetical protein [Chitinophagaceae bacterium]